MLLQVYEMPPLAVASRMDLPRKYLALSTCVHKVFGYTRSRQVCLASMEMLKVYTLSVPE